MRGRRRLAPLLGALVAGLLLAALLLLLRGTAAVGPGHRDGDDAAEQRRRQRRLRAACRAQGDSAALEDLPEGRLDHLLVDDEHALLYCAVPKVASTNWRRVLLALRSSRPDPARIPANRSHEPSAFRSLAQMRRQEQRRRLATHLKFLFARHPLERLLSAYRNKFERAWSDYFPLRYGRHIVRQQRGVNASRQALETGRGVTFDEFLRYVASLELGDHAAAFNEHWRPLGDLCFPCQLRYDVLGSYDTLERDSRVVLRRAGLEGRVALPSRRRTYSSEPTAALMQRYYGNVSGPLMARLRRVYRADMALFRYERSYPHFG
ncbi:carbohydrate sulfotransferase 11-like [Dermacentor variabilis]|uniref:carbohydrate sulfotransferase 11-like n=1 Tax=Dermacentor variabilis TaxID=34621 RepID=UPI003F5B69E0